MALENSFNIEQFLDLTGYDTEERVSRRKNSKVNSQEFFTPYSIVLRMCNKVPEEDWANPDKTFCEPSFGNGRYDVNDFLKMNNDNFENSHIFNNDEILKENNGKKFITIMNPPYGNRKYGDEFLHHKMTEKCLELSDRL